jgi:hypothetical protein
MDDKELWEEGRKAAEKDLEGIPVKINTGMWGFRNQRPVVFLNIPKRGNKVLVQMLIERGWRSWHSMNVQGKRIMEFEKVF